MHIKILGYSILFVIVLFIVSFLLRQQLNEIEQHEIQNIEWSKE